MLYSKGKDTSFNDFQWEIQEKRWKKNVIYKIPCKDCKLSYIGETSQRYDERESQHRRCIRNQDEIMEFSGIFETQDTISLGKKFNFSILISGPHAEK